MSVQVIALQAFRAGSGVLKGRSFERGQRISEKLYLRMEPSMRKKFSVVEKGSRNLWCVDEIADLIFSYMELADPASADVDAVIAAHHEAYPQRSVGSIQSRVWGILGIDTLCPRQGLGTYSQELVDALHALDPERFPHFDVTEGKVSGKLDALLADIRG